MYDNIRCPFSQKNVDVNTKYGKFLIRRYENNLKNYNLNINNFKSEYLKITPQTLLNLFDKNVAIVNVLDSDYRITDENFNTSNSFGKDFMYLNKELIKKFNLLVLYCGNYTCPASKTYADSLVKIYPTLKNKIVLYEGGLLEWASFSLIIPEKFCILEKINNSILNKRDLKKVFVDMNHWDEKKKGKKYPNIILENQNISNFFNIILLK